MISLFKYMIAALHPPFDNVTLFEWPGNEIVSKEMYNVSISATSGIYIMAIVGRILCARLCDRLWWDHTKCVARIKVWRGKMGTGGCQIWGWVTGVVTRVVTIRYPHDTIRIAILGSRYDTYRDTCWKWQNGLVDDAQRFSCYSAYCFCLKCKSIGMYCVIGMYAVIKTIIFVYIFAEL